MSQGLDQLDLARRRFEQDPRIENRMAFLLARERVFGEAEAKLEIEAFEGPTETRPLAWTTLRIRNNTTRRLYFSLKLRGELLLRNATVGPAGLLVAELRMPVSAAAADFVFEVDD